MKQYKNEFFNSVLTAADAFHSAKAALPAQEKELYSDFAGQRLLDEINAIKTNASQLEKALNDIHANLRDGMLAKAEESRSKLVKSKSLDPSAITADFQFLNLPGITLSFDELQTLVTRNAYNDLFLRAAKNYEQEHSVSWRKEGNLNHIDYASPHDKLIRAIHDSANYFTTWLSQGRGGYDFIRTNPCNLQQLDDYLTACAEAAEVKL